ncbi:winged helix-turn-helix transcriptional regulator [Loigolactobacillus zhaoyuanensis]|uniref:Winged helix-turn-helix transcriptional regulator n=1 Tax=Loigolactobacillus zhaoyuanensis TaxID=2486017 RepID=A0ABW8UDH6_9LACO|nr:winged helix-turn-helix transcriptional regulator [Loigolactobacillus zhaoyuanensis]
MTNYSLGINVSLKILNDKWAGLVVTNLATTPLDFMDLRKQIPGLSTLDLYNKLGELEQLNLLDLSEDAQVKLTANGEQLKQVLGELERWGARNTSPKLVAEY